MISFPQLHIFSFIDSHRIFFHHHYTFKWRVKWIHIYNIWKKYCGISTSRERNEWRKTQADNQLFNVVRERIYPIHFSFKVFGVWWNKLMKMMSGEGWEGNVNKQYCFIPFFLVNWDIRNLMTGWKNGVNFLQRNSFFLCKLIYMSHKCVKIIISRHEVWN